jgi:hypothetical protein
VFYKKQPENAKEVEKERLKVCKLSCPLTLEYIKKGAKLAPLEFWFLRVT